MHIGDIRMAVEDARDGLDGLGFVRRIEMQQDALGDEEIGERKTHLCERSPARMDLPQPRGKRLSDGFALHFAVSGRSF
jgi:hypothetical protein